MRPRWWRAVLGIAIAGAVVGCGGRRGLDVDASLLEPTTAAVTTTASGAPTTAEPAPATTTVTPATTARPHLTTLPPGSPLPDDAACAARVQPAPEVRPDNAPYNSAPGHPTAADPSYPRYARVTGSFTGTTDEIIQWAACKWGIDEDIVRAQAAKESYWSQLTLGDWSSDPQRCVPGHGIGADGKDGSCPESVGLLQVRAPYFPSTIADAVVSTSYNLDVSYAVWRTCFEGEEQWLNTVDRGQDYAAGDLWGCVGRWYAGRWYTDAAKQYIAAVKDNLANRVWESASFARWRG